MSDQTTELVNRLREHADRDNCVSHNWGGALFDAGQDCADAADLIERLDADAACELSEKESLKLEVDRLQLLAADYGGQLTAAHTALTSAMRDPGVPARVRSVCQMALECNGVALDANVPAGTPAAGASSGGETTGVTLAPTDGKDPTPPHLLKQGYRSGHT